MADLPTLRCKGLCHDQCTIVPMTAREVQALQAATGRQFDLHPYRGPFHGGREFVLVAPGNLRCPALTDANRCAGYESRPLLCRLYGMTRDMQCPHGCEPSRWLTPIECFDMIRATEVDHGFA